MKLIALNKFAGSLMIVAALFHPIAASAETDLAKVTCGEFNDIMMSNDPKMEVGGALIMGFLWGLYKGDDDSVVIGNASDNKKLGKLGAFCKTNPTVNLIKAADMTMDD